MKKGFLYIATGEKYIKEVKLSAKITKKHMNLPITVVSDREVKSKYIDNVIIDESPERSFYDKPRNLLKSPYDKTIYMDGDAQLVQPVSELFELLDYADIATAIDPNEYELRYMDEVDFGNIPESIPLFQTGVIVYKQTEECREFINTWVRIHRSDRIERDQTSFRKAITEVNVNHIALSNVYNCLVGWPMQVTGDVKIIHGRISQPAEQKIDDINTRMNSTEGPRLFYYPTRGSVYAPTKPRLNSILLLLSQITARIYSMKKLLNSLYSSYQSRGILKTLIKILKYIIKRTKGYIDDY